LVRRHEWRENSDEVAQPLHEIQHWARADTHLSARLTLPIGQLVEPERSSKRVLAGWDEGMEHFQRDEIDYSNALRAFIPIHILMPCPHSPTDTRLENPCEAVRQTIRKSVIMAGSHRIDVAMP